MRVALVASMGSLVSVSAQLFPIFPRPTLPDEIEVKGLVSCLVENDCLDIDMDAEIPIDIGKIVNCVQRIPIINPAPACEDYIDVLGLPICIAGCPEDEMACTVECLLDGIEINDDIRRPVQNRIEYQAQDESVRLAGKTECLSFQVGVGGIFNPFPDNLEMKPCTGIETEQLEFTDGTLRVIGGDKCAQPKSGLSPRVRPGDGVEMTGCGGFRADQDFSYNQETGFVVHDDSGLCVAGPDSRFGSGVTLENCNASLDRQMVWNRQSSPRQTVADILDGDANLKSFTDALRGSGLFARTEDENSQTTVYAPTNEAFNALEPATLQVLFSDPMLLQETLLFHQTDGTRFTDDVTKRCLPNVGCTGESTLSGSRMPILQEIECDRSGFFICYNRAMFTYFGAEKALLDMAHRDLAATNGVVHYINKLLVPDSVKAKVEAAIQTKSIS